MKLLFPHYPFVLSLSKDMPETLHMGGLFRSWFDGLTTNAIR